MAAVAVFTRVFPPAEYGIYSLLISIAGPVTTVFTEWAGQPVGRYFAVYQHEQRLAEYFNLVAKLVALDALVLLSVLSTLGLALVLFFGSLPRPLLLLGLGVGILASSVVGIPLRILPASLKAKRYRVAIIVPSALSVLLGITFVYLFGPRVAWLVWANALATLAVLPYVYHHAGLRGSHLYSALTFGDLWRGSRSIFMRFWRYGYPMTLWMLAAALMSVGDRYSIQFFAGPTAVGIYSVNYNLVAMAVGFVSGPITVAAFPILLQQWSRNERTQAQLTLARITSILFILGLGLVGGVAVIGKPLVELLLGRQFWSGYVVQLPVCVGAILWSLSILGQKSMEFHEKTRMMMYDAALAAVLNVVLNIIFIPLFGYVAAAYTTMFTYAVYVALVWWQSRSFTEWKLGLSAWSVAYCIGAFALAYLASRALVLPFHAPQPIVLLGGISFSVVYLGMVSSQLRSLARGPRTPNPKR